MESAISILESEAVNEDNGDSTDEEMSGPAVQGENPNNTGTGSVNKEKINPNTGALHTLADKGKSNPLARYR